MQSKTKFFWQRLRGIAPVLLIAGALAACSSGAANNDRRSVDVGQLNISWINFSKVSDLHRKAFSLGANERIYLFSYTGSAKTFTLSNGMTFSSANANCFHASMATGKWNQVLHDECEAKKRALITRASPGDFKNFIRLSEQAVRADGDCTWLGYDRALDQKVRAVGEIVRMSNERIFFAKLLCR